LGGDRGGAAVCHEEGWRPRGLRPPETLQRPDEGTTKREISPSTVERVVDEIEAELRTRGKVEIPSREVGELVMDKLRGLDEVAYIRFASVYRSFMDLQEVKHEIDQLLSREKRG